MDEGDLDPPSHSVQWSWVETHILGRPFYHESIQFCVLGSYSIVSNIYVNRC